VSPHKRLAGVWLVEQIPRTPAGKILRRVLRDQAALVAS
jgi:acyl-coenzyme A synthetase/AMP-(fatty) acid ligase